MAAREREGEGERERNDEGDARRERRRRTGEKERPARALRTRQACHSPFGCVKLRGALSFLAAAPVTLAVDLGPRLKPLRLPALAAPLAAVGFQEPFVQRVAVAVGVRPRPLLRRKSAFG